ncbi:hypothetical protein [uncultured Legionella sp.]|uniref:hypothetical protein n=1 Tax=uncultured Legionella sp. TaxID=210934 RepID=UPI00261F6875|nr:hypothetical protein [uncultured Legionella sp.]
MTELFTFREQSDNNKFYLVGASKCPNFYKPLQTQYSKGNLSITSNMDIYQIREHLDRILKTQKKPVYQFVLTPNWKDGHATCLVHIINPESRRVMATVFINSWQKEEYFEYIFYRFNLKHTQALSNGQVIEPNDLRTCNIPFIDASHQLQVHVEDSNCTLYGYNIVDAIARMLGDPSVAQRVVTAAEAMEQDEPSASQGLRTIFAEELKDYLPCYYTGKNNNPHADIKAFHLLHRWNVGSELFSLSYSPRPGGTEVILEPTCTKIFKPIVNEDSSSLAYIGKDNVVRYVFDNVLPIIESEKMALPQI